MAADEVVSRREGRRIARNSVVLAASQTLVFGLGFATTILVTSSLGSEYGLFIGAQRFVTFFVVVVRLGLHPLLVRRVAARRGDPGVLLGTVLALRVALGFAFVGLVMASAEVGGYLVDHRVLLLAFALIEFLGVIVETYVAVCEGLERMEYSALIAATRAICTFAGVVTVVLLGGGLGEIILVYAGTRIVQFAVALLSTRAAARSLKVRIRPDLVAPLLREGVPYFGVILGFAALRSVDVVMLTRLSSIEESALYGAAFNFLDVLFALPMLVQRALLPALSRLDGTDQASSLTRITTRVFYLVLLPAAVGLYLLADHAVALYPSGEFADAAPVLQILSLTLVLLPPISVCSTRLTGAGLLGRIVVCYAISLPLQAAANAVLIPQYAARGAAMGTAVGYAVLALTLLVAARGRGAGLFFDPLWRYALAAAAVAAAVSATAEWPLPVVVIGGAAVYLVGLAVLLPGDSVERRLARELLDSARSRLRRGSGPGASPPSDGAGH